MKRSHSPRKKVNTAQQWKANSPIFRSVTFVIPFIVDFREMTKMCLKLINASIQFNWVCVCRQMQIQLSFTAWSGNQPNKPIGKYKLWASKTVHKQLCGRMKNEENGTYFVWRWHVHQSLLLLRIFLNIFRRNFYSKNVYDNEIWYVRLNRQQQQRQQQNSCQVYGKLDEIAVCVLFGYSW